MNSLAKDHTENTADHLNAGIISLTEATAPSWLEAVGAVVRRLGSTPEEIESNLDTIPIGERDTVKEFLRLAGHLPTLSKQVYQTLAGTERKISGSQVVKLPVGATSSNAWESRNALPIDLSRVVVISKQSSLQYYMQTRNKTAEEILSKLSGATREKLEGGHLKHLESINRTQELLTAQQVISQAEFVQNPSLLKGASLVISLGGDDHLKLVSQSIDDDTPIIGINSDPQNSRGFLLSGSIDELQQILKNLQAGQYIFEPWSRLRLQLDGKDIGPALDEIVIAQQSFNMISRHILEFEGKKIEHASSGLIIATGSGSTAWIDSAGLYLHPNGLRFPPTARCARFLLREPARKWSTDVNGELRASLPELAEGLLPAGKKLLIHSQNRRGQGVIMRDSLQTTNFQRDSVAEIFLDPKPLWVIKPQLGAKFEF